MPGPLTVDLHAVREPRRGLLGGKGAGLAALASAGLPVPPGFCLTTDAYREALAGLVDAGRVEPGALRDGLPEAVREAVATALAALAGRDEGVAVRSSATVEDGAASSFAGQQVTTLNVRGAEAVLEAMRHGRMYAARGGDGMLLLSSFRVDTELERAVAGEEVASQGDAEVHIRIDKASGGEEQTRVRLIKSGEVVAQVSGVTPLEFKHIDTSIQPGEKVYYRLLAYSRTARLTSNPIFVTGVKP